jgi:Mn2+/Fe2+ NRAMP family transporter
LSNQIETFIEVKLSERNQVNVLFRYILIVPVLIFAAAFSPNSTEWAGIGIGVIVLPVLLAIVFRGVYPSYALRFNQAILELSTRITAYALLLNDNYPSIEGNSSVRVLFPEVDGGKKLNRLLPLVKWLLAIPLYIVGIIYTIYGLIMLIVGWFAVIFTRELPQACAEVLFGVTRFWNRVLGYAFLLVTDEYPSFTLKE